MGFIELLGRLKMLLCVFVFRMFWWMCMVLFGLVFMGLVMKVVKMLWCSVVLCIVCLNRNIWLVRFMVFLWVKLIFIWLVLVLWIRVFIFRWCIL